MDCFINYCFEALLNPHCFQCYIAQTDFYCNYFVIQFFTLQSFFFKHCFLGRLCFLIIKILYAREEEMETREKYMEERLLIIPGS